MHFWIDKRANPYQYGRRRFTCYNTSSFSSSTIGRQRNKPYRGHDNPHASPYRPPPPSSMSPGPSSSFYGNVSTPEPRSQMPYPGGSRDPHLPTSSNGPGVGDLGSPYGTRRSRSVGGAGGQSQYVSRMRSRSQSRERRAAGVSRAERRRRSTSGSRRQGSVGSGITSSDVAVRAALTELQQVMTADLRTDSPFSSSEAVDSPKWSKTKRIGLTLCFMGVILLCTVAAKFLIEGPGVIDTTRRGQTHETAVYFFFTELVFLAFAMALFFTGVACLRKRTNAYLLRQFNQHILHSQSRSGSRSTPGGPDDSFLDPPEDEESGEGLTNSSESPFTNLHQHPEGLSPISTPVHNCVFHSALISSGGGRRAHHLINIHTDGRPPRRCPHFHNSAAALLQKQQPPPYNVALYLPLPSHDHFAEPAGLGGSEPKRNEDDLEKEKQEEDLVAIAISQSSRVDPETPPPSYEEFTFQI